MLDDNGQPLNRFYNRKRLSDRAVDELIGLSKGILADKNINQHEAEFLKSWMEANISFCEDPVVNQLYCRIQEMLIDGILDENEQRELMGILAEFTGESALKCKENLSSKFPLCKPAPEVEFPTMTFCLTGKFAYGPRHVCEEIVIERGGKCMSNVTNDVDYLVIGYLASFDWIHTSYGRKIEKAVDYRNRYGLISIISEDHWAETAFKMCPPD